MNQADKVMEYTDSVDHSNLWRDLGEALERWGIKAFAASLLEALGPLTIVVAQMAYIGQPLISSFIKPGRFQEVVRLLEEPDQTREFVAYLREDIL